MATGPRDLRLEFDDDSADPEELADLTGRLRSDLLELDVDAVTYPSDADVPSGAKAAEALAVGTMLVHLALRQELLTAVARSILSWIGRQRVRSIKLTLDGDTLDISNISSDDQDRLIDLWVKRHAEQ